MHVTVKRLAALLLCGAALPSLASENSYVNQFRNLEYTQTDNLTLSAQGAFFSASAVVSGLAIATYDSGTMTIGDPNAGPSYALTSSDGGHSFGMQTPSLPSQAAMDTQFPLASHYTYLLTGGPDSTSASMDVGANNYAAAPPLLTGNSFSALQGMDSAQPLSLGFNPFNAVPGAAAEFVFLSFYNYTTATWLYPLGFAPRTTTGLTLAAGRRPAGTRQQLRLRVDLQRAREPARRWRRFRAGDRLRPAHQRPVCHCRARARHVHVLAVGAGGAGRVWTNAQGSVGEFPSPTDSYSITSVALSSSGFGIVRPSALAIFKLTISSNFEGCSIGISAGLPPRSTPSIWR